MIISFIATFASGNNGIIYANTFRNIHNASSLLESQALYESSKDWANHMADNNILKHSTNENIGENIAFFSNVPPDFDQNSYIKKSIDLWYEEEKYYDFTIHLAKI